MTNLVQAIDVSSHQDRDLTGIIRQYQPSHVVVKCYQTVERKFQQCTLDQMASAQANGCSVGGYVWLYGGLDPAQQVADAIAISQAAGVTLPILWLDLETYHEADGSTTWPSYEETVAAVEACERQGMRAGLYTGNWFVEGYWGGHVGLLAQYPVWLADYNGVPDLNTPSPYWAADKILGHQYQGNPIDLNVFDPSVTTLDSITPESSPSYEELQTIIGYLTHDLMDGFEGEANRKPIRKSQLLALVETGRSHAL